MSLLADLEAELRAYLAGQRTLAQLQEWDAAHTLAIAAAQDEAAERLSGLLMLLMSEYSYGHRSEESVQEELRAALRDLQPLATLNVTQWQLPEPPRLATGTASQLQTVDLWVIGQPYDVPRTYHAPRVTIG